MGFIKSILKALGTSGTLAWLLMACFITQSYLVPRHVSHHHLHKIESAQHAAPVLNQGDCQICDNASLPPELPQVTVDAKAERTAQTLEALPPIFCSDNEILRPFGARAPPVIALI